MMTALVDSAGLVVSYATPRGSIRALDGADLLVGRDETLAIVGESGSGKTTLGMALGRLLPAGARREAGSLRVAGLPVFDAPEEALRRLRRETLGFVFQNPMTALDPTMRIGRQVARALGGRPRTTEGAAQVAALLARLELDAPERVMRSFPHQLSGGMAQRVVIAMAIARNPALVVTGEPTASLDASIRERVMATLMALRAASGASLIVLSHDLRMAARHADNVAVMYGGRIVEYGTGADVLACPVHPCTAALIAAAAGSDGPDGRLRPIPGAPPVLHGDSPGCTFAPRCPLREARCAAERPARRRVAGRDVLCHVAAPPPPAGAP